MYTKCMPDILILAQTVLKIFCSQGCCTTQNAKSEKENNSVKYLQNFAKSKSGHLHIKHNL